MFQPADVLINAYSVIYKQVRLDRIITHIASGLFSLDKWAYICLSWLTLKCRLYNMCIDG